MTKQVENPLLQPIMLLLSVGAFLMIIGLGSEQQIHAYNSRTSSSVTTSNSMIRQRKVDTLNRNNDKSNRLLLSNKNNTHHLVPRNEYYAQFYEYQPDSFDFTMYRNKDGNIYSNVEVVDDKDVITTYRVDCYDVTKSIAKCNSTEFHLLLDIYTANNANENESGYPTIYYTRTDGVVDYVKDEADVIVTTPSSDDRNNNGDHTGSNEGSTNSEGEEEDSRVYDWYGITSNIRSGASSIKDWMLTPDDTMNVIGIVSIAIAASLLLLTLAIVVYRRRQRFIRHKMFMDFMDMEGSIRHSSSHYSKNNMNNSNNNFSLRRNSNIGGTCGGGNDNSNHDDSTEMYEFSEDSDFDPTELREVDLTR